MKISVSCSPNDILRVTFYQFKCTVKIIINWVTFNTDEKVYKNKLYYFILFLSFKTSFNKLNKRHR